MFGILFWFCVLIILYTYLGYPLLLALASRLSRAQRTRPAEASEAPSVTLLISAYNEEDVIRRKIGNTLSLDYPADKLQVLVAADGSADGTADIVREYADRGVQLVYDPVRRGKSAAIDHAVQSARGDILVFSDANNMYAREALRELVAPLADPQVGGVSGAKVIAQGEGGLDKSEGLYWKYESLIKKWETRLGSCTGVAGEILAVRRALFEPVPARVINDDFYMALGLIRRGYRVVYAPRARSYERASASASDEMARRARIVAGRYQALVLAPRLLSARQPLIVWQVVSHKFLRPLVPFAMAGALIANVLALVFAGTAQMALLTLAFPVNQILIALQLAFYLAALVGNRFGRKGKLGKLLYLATFLVNSNMAAVVGLYRFLTRQQTTLWKRVARAE